MEVVLGAAGVSVGTALAQRTGAYSIANAKLHHITVNPIPLPIARGIVVRNHYLHSMPGGSCLAFGVFWNKRLLGAVTLGAGPVNAHKLVTGASQGDCLTLTRLWLSDELPRNSESRVVGTVLRGLRSHTSLRFVLSYADPTQGHIGTIYQATNWAYTGLCVASPLYDLGNGLNVHSRTLAGSQGTRSIKHLEKQGLHVKVLSQIPKHRYVYFVDQSWRARLRVPVMPYPKRTNENS